jgi:hypothetical protein
MKLEAKERPGLPSRAFCSAEFVLSLESPYTVIRQTFVSPAIRQSRAGQQHGVGESGTGESGQTEIALTEVPHQV